MNDLISLAIASILEKETKDFKKEIAPGVYAVDTTISVTIKATVKKGEPSEYTPTCDIPLKETLALILEKAGFQRENMMKIIVECMKEAMESKTKGNSIIAERLKDIDVAMERVSTMTEQLPKKSKQGIVTIKGNVTIEEPALTI
jgi:mannitol-specific phosphotransferase system IIBC component